MEGADSAGTAGPLAAAGPLAETSTPAAAGAPAVTDAGPAEDRPGRTRFDGDDLRVVLDGVHLKLGDRRVFRGLSCGFPRGRISVVLGGSGGGKSTMLRLIGGLLRPDEGSVRVAGQDMSRLSPSKLYQARKGIGMLFQGGALLDSMTVYENVALPLREHSKLSERDVAAEVNRRLEAVGLSGVGELYPRQLSGGMMRRAALARAIVEDPQVVLCDEPFSGLDPVNVRRIESLLMRLNRRLGLTLIVTSHHVPSTLRMADRIVFLADGVAVTGTPQSLLQGDDRRVAEFLAAESDDWVEPPADTAEESA